MMDLDFDCEIMEGSTIVSRGVSHILINGEVSREIDLNLLAERIKSYLKNRDKVFVSDLVEHFRESADIIFRALKILKDKGEIEEVSS